MYLALVALGSNLPWRESPSQRVILAALKRLETVAEVVARSGLWMSPASPDPTRPAYVNAAAKLRVAGDPWDFLNALHAIEHAFARERSGRWDDRTLDLELIDFDGRIVQGLGPTELQLPHPRAHGRGFVLFPLRDVAPLWRAPDTGRSIDELIAALPPPSIWELKRIGG